MVVLLEQGLQLLGLGDRTTRDIPLSAEELHGYTGLYDLGLTQVEVVSADGRLRADVSLRGVSGRYVFLNQGDHVFQAQGDSEISVTFAMEDGRATDFVLLRKGITMRARRVGG